MSPRWEYLDAFARRHPRLALAGLLALAVFATVVLLARSEGAVVLYQRF
ncbi:MAG TPA: hypothetical protein VJV75_02620 [Candidatus Polarisedimenticolia bacterium]|nr:hypothetical protein [Candidatus Polarisedimenticolia bacterium]